MPDDAPRDEPDVWRSWSPSFSLSDALRRSDLLILTGGLGLIFYLVAWAVMPREESFEARAAYRAPVERQQS